MSCQQIGAFEAKTHFSKIIDQIEKGDEFLITKRGKPVARIVPIKQEKQMSRKEAFNALKEMRKLYRGKPGEFSIREAINKGRKN